MNTSSTDGNLLEWMRAQIAFAADHLSNVTPKTAATFNIVSLLAVVVVMSVWQPDMRKSSDQVATAPLAPQPVTVKMIDAAPRGTACREQTWPYIDRDCLNYGASQPETLARAPEPVTAPAPQIAIPAQIVPPQQSAVKIDSERVIREQASADLDEPDYYQPTDEELRAQARQEARQRRRAARRNHFVFGPFRF